MMATPDSVDIRAADLTREDHREAVVALIEMYALSPTAGGVPLPAETREILGERLAAFDGHHVLLAYLGERPVGVAVCFLGFSTFRARPLLNLHDLAVEPELRGRGIGRKLLMAVDDLARTLGCCRVTLEVFANNDVGRHLYRSCGYLPAEDGETQMLFLTKSLD